MTKMLNSENILDTCGIDPEKTNINMTADKILLSYAINQCQSAALDELFGNPGECFQVNNMVSISFYNCPLVKFCEPVCGSWFRRFI